MAQAARAFILHTCQDAARAQEGEKVILLAPCRDLVSALSAYFPTTGQTPTGATWRTAAGRPNLPDTFPAFMAEHTNAVAFL